jgi:hypothetical protein
MMTPPLRFWARPFLLAQVDVSTVMGLSPSGGCGRLVVRGGIIARGCVRA